MMTNLPSDRTVGEIVAQDYRTAGVFKKYGLDFCCGGGRSLSDACSRKGIDPDILLKELNALSIDEQKEHRYNEWSCTFLIDYIINNHHQYVRRVLPEVKGYAQKVAKVHGKTYPVLKDMLGLFLVLKDEMLSHLDSEEQILFPYIKEIDEARFGGKRLFKEQMGNSSAKVIALMETEHEEAGKIMTKLEELSNGFAPPSDACTTFKVYFKNLEAFRDDLHKHVHLENNILFPKALKLEEQHI